MDESTWKMAEQLSSAMRRDIVFYTEAGNENGYYENGVIYINTLGADPLLQVFSHELTHSIESADAYGSLSKTVLQLMELEGVQLDLARQAKIEQYSRAGHALKNAAAVDQELVAEYVSKHLLTDESSITSLVQQNRNLGQKIKNWFDKLLSLFGNKNAQERAFLERARNIYSKALLQTNAGTEAKNNDMVAPMGRETPGAMGEEADPIAMLDAQLQAGEITEEEYDAAREEMELQQEEHMTLSERQYSISEIEGEKKNYGQGVILDTDIFDGIRPGAWGKVLSEYVYNHLAGMEMTVYDEAGNPETIYLAKTNDRVRKNGAKNSHKVLDKLAGYRGDNVRAKAIVQMSEVLAASKFEKSTDAHSHQWMDENGWVLRKVYLQTLDGDIYEATLNIADGRERKTLYEINKVHWIDKKETSASIPSTDISQRSRYQEHEMGGTQSEAYDKTITETKPDVKKNNGRKYSLGEETVSKKDVSSDLRAILSRGSSTRELRQYVAQLERAGNRVEENQSEAERIVQAARKHGISVDEYLRQNWERYDQDGQWNQAARKALDMEKNAGRKYSISDDAEASPEHVDIRSIMPKKAQNDLKRTERKLLDDLTLTLHVPSITAKPYLEPVIQELTDIYLQEGTISQENMDLLFDKAYAQGFVACKDYLTQYHHTEIYALSGIRGEVINLLILDIFSEI